MHPPQPCGRCVSLLLQRLSTRRASRALFHTADVRGVVLAFLHATSEAAPTGSAATERPSPDGVQFVRANLRSVVQNTAPPTLAAEVA